MVIIVYENMVFIPGKHVFIIFLENDNVLWAHGGTKRFSIEIRIE